MPGLKLPREMRSPPSAGLIAMLCFAALLVACGNTADDPGSSGTVPNQPLDSAGASAPAVETPAETVSAPVEGTLEEEMRAAAAVLDSYYAAINEGALDRAYLLWADSGRASGQTLAEFREGYAETARVEMRPGQGSLEGAAGSRYAEIPVQIDAVTRDGSEQRFEGSYVLRRSVVDGATSEQRTWRIYSAEIREVR